MVVFEEKSVVFGQSCCTRAKVVVVSDNVIVFGPKLLYTGIK